MKLKQYSVLVCGMLASAMLVACNGGNGSGATNNGLQVLAPLVTSGVELKALTSGASVNLSLYSITKGNGVYVAVGDGGSIITSTDGNTWSSVDSGVSVDIHDVAYNASTKLFYAVGDNSTVLSSANGTTWTQYKSLTPMRNLYSVMSVNGDLVIGADNSTIFEIATNGRQVVVFRNTVDNMKLISAASGNGMMILGSDDGSILYKYANNMSADWNRATRFAGVSINGLSYDSTDKWFLASTSTGNTIQSGNGVVWSLPLALSSSSLNAVVLDSKSNDFFAVGGSADNSVMLISDDYNAWKQQTLPVTKVQLNDVKCFDKSDCFIVGDSGTILSGLQRGGTLQLPTWTLVSGVDSSTPTVSMSSPINHASNVPKNSTIQIQFSESVNNVNASNISLHADNPTGTTLAISNISSGANNTYSFKPSTTLNNNTRYYVVIGSGITDTTGTALVATRFSFTTVDNLTLNSLSESAVSWNNTLQNIPVGSFGLYGFVVTNNTDSQLTSIDLMKYLPSSEFSFDSSRSSCLAKSTSQFPMILAPNTSCSLVVRYAPVNSGDFGVMNFVVNASDTNGEVTYKSNEIKISYSSRL